MKSLKQLVASATVLAMICCATVNAQPYGNGPVYGNGPAVSQDACYAESLGGCGYQESCRSPYIAPAVALGTIALVAIIAVAVQNSSHSHGHAHN